MAALNAVSRGYGTPVLFLHGWSVDHRIMLPLDEMVAAHPHPWRRIYVDLPGFGRSAGDNDIAHSDDIAAAIDTFIDDEIGDLPMAVIGSSFGAGLARRLMARDPQRILGCALICPTAEPIDVRRLPAPLVIDRDEALLATLHAADRDDFMSTTVRQDAQMWERFEQCVIPGLRAADPDVVERIRPSLSVSPEASGPAFDRPVLMVMGRNDTIVGWRDQLDLAEHYPDSTVVVIDRCGHNAHLEHPEIVAVHLRTWLDALSG